MWLIMGCDAASPYTAQSMSWCGLDAATVRDDWGDQGPAAGSTCIQDPDTAVAAASECLKQICAAMCCCGLDMWALTEPLRSRSLVDGVLPYRRQFTPLGLRIKSPSIPLMREQGAKMQQRRGWDPGTPFRPWHCEGASPREGRRKATARLATDLAPNHSTSHSLPPPSPCPRHRPLSRLEDQQALTNLQTAAS